MPFPNPETQFQPGQSGNPAGHSAGRRLTAELRALIDEKNAWRPLASVWLQQALKGKYPFLREALDRLDGPIETERPTELNLSDLVSAAEARAEKRISERDSEDSGKAEAADGKKPEGPA